MIQFHEYRLDKKKKVECQHEFIYRQGSNNIRYHIYKLFPSIEFRYKC